MLLGDVEIKKLIEDGVLVNGLEENVGPVTYDLRTAGFVSQEGPQDCATCILEPGDSTFVKCIEGVKLPNDLAAQVMLRNSRIREGLTLDAPLYFPGHGTVLFFRVTNVSGSTVELDRQKGIAQVAFERVEEPVEHPYEGAFQGEANFSGMARYSDVYGDEIRQIEKKTDEVKGIEHRIYGNVMAIMAILAGVFTLVNVNVGAVGSSQGALSIIALNLATVGSFAALVALISVVVGEGAGAQRWKLIAALSAVAFVAAVACAVAA